MSLLIFLKNAFASIIQSLGPILLSLILLVLPIQDLPKASGASAVGTTRIDFVQPNRLDLLTQTTGEQKMTAQVFYPTDSTSGYQRAQWLDEKAVPALSAVTSIPESTLNRMASSKTNSYWNAPLSNKQDKYPVVIYSPGLYGINTFNTIQAEELASNGYVVIAVGHPKDNAAVVSADGEVTPASLEQLGLLMMEEEEAIAAATDAHPGYPTDPEGHRTEMRISEFHAIDATIWANDMSFMADEFTKLNNGTTNSMFKNKLDMDNLGVFGQSFGGAAAGQVCLQDDRFKAFINMEGSPYGTAVDNIIDKPFLVFNDGTDVDIPAPYTGYSAQQSDFFSVTIAGSSHNDYTDINYVSPILGKIVELTGMAIKISGTIKPARMQTIMNDYVLQFFDHYLKGKEAPILQATKYSETSMEVFGDPYNKI